MALTPDELRIDLDVAKMLLRERSGPLSENPNAINMAAYHAGQCIEKSLKHIIGRNCDKETYESIGGVHDMKVLLCAIMHTDRDFLKNHREIVQYAYPLSRINSLRYSTMRVTKKNATKIVDIAEKLYSEIETDYLKANPDKDKNWNEMLAGHAKKTDIITKSVYEERRMKQFALPAVNVETKESTNKHTARKKQAYLLPDEIKVNLDIAKRIMNDSSAEINGNPYSRNIAAYHAGQCIEKSLKNIASRKCNDAIWEQVHETHDIKALLYVISQENPNFLKHHQEFVKFAFAISRVNGLRYHNNSISEKNTHMLIGMATKVFREVENAYLHKFPDKDQNLEYMRHTYYEKPELFERSLKEESKITRAAEKSGQRPSSEKNSHKAKSHKHKNKTEHEK